MRAFAIRVLRNGLPVAVLLAAVGYGMAQMAEMMAGRSPRPTPGHVPELSTHLEYRLPLTMAAWGLGLVVALEALFSLWRQPVPPASEGKPLPPMDEAEQLLLRLLEEADAAERARSMPSAADPTPPPRGVPAVPPAEAVTP